MVLGVQLKTRSWIRNTKHEVLQVWEGRPYTEGLNRRCACKAAVVGVNREWVPWGLRHQEVFAEPFGVGFGHRVNQRRVREPPGGLRHPGI